MDQGKKQRIFYDGGAEKSFRILKILLKIAAIALALKYIFVEFE